MIVQWLLSMDVFIGLQKRTKNASGKFILAFDFGSEKSGEITPPNYHHVGHNQSHGYEFEVSVTVLRESLAVIVSCYKTRLIGCCDIWAMREYGMAESWSKLYSIVPNKRILRCLGMVNNRDLMWHTSREGEEERIHAAAAKAALKGKGTSTDGGGRICGTCLRTYFLL
ncbi:hypothetical protein Dsin_027062 [Dipteronia sinensis]|uniref:F-box associated beta-propeller type 1 domain-containing protein n=1 Tax=Dipteronia sinensis TaxID=43782 RepID=A0AAE0DYG5_9ROSI|nr:hypothetical protein Dsin_027062 [Dipteronia sinensis]